LKKINDKDIRRFVNEVHRPFLTLSEIEASQNKYHYCGDCTHCKSHTTEVEGYLTPYFVCDLLNREIDWIFRDPRPNDCPFEKQN